jgi:hypothetical protein
MVAGPLRHYDIVFVNGRAIKSRVLLHAVSMGYKTALGSQVNPEGEGFEVLVREAVETGIYKKIVIRNGTLAGAVWMGTRKGAAEITRLAASGKNIDKWKAVLLEDDFDFSSL